MMKLTGQSADVRTAPVETPVCVPCRVLVVDDSEDTAESFASLLKLQGHNARALSDALRVLATIEHLRPQVIFMDIGMPGMDGWELARVLRERFTPEQLRLVAVTGYSDGADFARSRNVGFDAHLVKPASSELVNAILHTLFPAG